MMSLWLTLLVVAAGVFVGDGVEAISKSYSLEKCARRENLLRTSKNPNSFISKSASLWNCMSDQFRTLELTARGAKNEARKVAARLPMF